MDFSIESKGMDDIRKSIDKLSKGMDPQELGHWAKRIEKIAKKICDDKLSVFAKQNLIPRFIVNWNLN